MGFAYESVRIQVVGTAHVGYTEGTYGSRTTFGTGWAVYELGRKITAEMCERAAEAVGRRRGGCARRGRHVLWAGRQGGELCGGGGAAEKPLTASASVFPWGFGPGFAAHIVDVEVDSETGKVDILRYTALQDVGKAIHPAMSKASCRAARRRASAGR